MSVGRRMVRYGVAVSLDGYIAGPNGEYDWIVEDPEVDASLAEAWSRFDTFLMRRKTYEVSKPILTRENLGHRTVVVASRTLPPIDGITVVRDLNRTEMTKLREQEGKDIWMFGGGELFRHLLAMGEIDGSGPGCYPGVAGGRHSVVAANSAAHGAQADLAPGVRVGYCHA